MRLAVARRAKREPAGGRREASDAAVDRAPPPRPARRRTGMVWPMLAGALLIGGTSFGVAGLVVQERAEGLAAEQRLQALTLAEANASLISARLAGLSQLARRITGSELVQVYAASAAGAAEPPDWLGLQAPFIEQLFEDFVAQHELLAAALMAPDGDVILTVGELAEGPALPEHTGNGIDPVVTPIYELARDGGSTGELAFDLLLPVPGSVASDAPGEPVLLVMTLAAEPALAGMLGSGPAAGFPAPLLAQAGFEGPRLRLGGRSDAGPTSGGDPAPAAGTVRAEVQGTPWTLVQPLAAAVADPSLAAYERRAFALATGVAILISLAFGTYCGAVARQRRRDRDAADAAVAEQARRFGEMLEGLAGTVSDGIGLKDADGRYLYANAAFCERLERPAAQIIGRTDAELRSGGRPAGDDPEATSLPALVDARSFELGHTEAGLALVVAPREVPGRSAAAEALLPAALAGHLTIDQAVRLLVRAVELRDPFLRGHGERVAELAVAVGRRLELGEAELATIDLAARLSQVGKIFIPDAILTKPGRHTDDEVRTMRTHVAQALEVIDEIDFGLPVAWALGQMHERLDGSGYPRGLAGEEIGLPGRILGAVDVFCARTAPRAYRDRVSAGQALFHLAGQPERYDTRVVTALVGVIAGLRGPQAALPAPAQLRRDPAEATAHAA